MGGRGPTGQAEEIFRTYQHLRVIRALAQSPEASTKYKLVKSSGINVRQVTKILEVLKKYGWVSELEGMPRKFRLNTSNESVVSFLGVLEKLGYL